MSPVARHPARPVPRELIEEPNRGMGMMEDHRHALGPAHVHHPFDPHLPADLAHHRFQTPEEAVGVDGLGFLLLYQIRVTEGDPFPDPGRGRIRLYRGGQAEGGLQAMNVVEHHGGRGEAAEALLARGALTQRNPADHAPNHGPPGLEAAVGLTLLDLLAGGL